MRDDSVREELQVKTAPVIERRIEMPTVSERIETVPEPALKKPIEVKPPIAPIFVPSRPLIAAAPARKRDTDRLPVAKTSPTLVGFQNKPTAMPDWRIELQNSVQQRRGTPSAPAGEVSFPTHGSAALKVEPAPRVEAQPKPEIADTRVANALRRIEESRKTFLEKPQKQAVAASNVRSFIKPDPVSPPLAVMSTAAAAAPARAKVVSLPQPQPIAAVPQPIAFKRDTNKLPPIEQVLKPIETPEPQKIERVEKLASGPLDAEFVDVKRIRIKADDTEETRAQESETNEIEDLAPFSMRFGAGLFDLIIGSFATMLLLSPVAFTGGNWLSLSGGILLATTFSCVMFVYMTICLGFFGKTVGMRLFSLELVDAIENEYPTLRQAAVSSSVFIFSLLFGGIGFLTVPFNEEKRAAHDLLSGTILVREF